MGLEAQVSQLPGSDHAIKALHAEIEKLAAFAATAYVPHGPLGTATNGMGDEMVMFYDANHVKVFTCDGTVFISGIEHGGYWPDWFCLPRSQARLIAQALLSASAHVPDNEAT